MRGRPAAGSPSGGHTSETWGRHHRLRKKTLDFSGKREYNSYAPKRQHKFYAGVMELADVMDSKSIGSDTVRVQVPRPALLGRGKDRLDTV